MNRRKKLRLLLQQKEKLALLAAEEETAENQATPNRSLIAPVWPIIYIMYSLHLVVYSLLSSIFTIWWPSTNE